MELLVCWDLSHHVSKLLASSKEFHVKLEKTNFDNNSKDQGKTTHRVSADKERSQKVISK